MKFCKVCSKWHEGSCVSPPTEKAVRSPRKALPKLAVKEEPVIEYLTDELSSDPELDETPLEVAAQVRHGAKNPAGCNIIGIKYGKGKISDILNWEEKKIRAYGTYFLNCDGFFLEQLDTETVLVIESPYIKNGTFHLTP